MWKSARRFSRDGRDCFGTSLSARGVLEHNGIAAVCVSHRDVDLPKDLQVLDDGRSIQPKEVFSDSNTVPLRLEIQPLGRAESKSVHFIGCLTAAEYDNQTIGPMRFVKPLSGDDHPVNSKEEEECTNGEDA